MTVKPCVTIYSSELRWTVAYVSTMKINTGAIILTWTAMAIKSSVTITPCELG